MITLRQIAKEADVSVATVSRAFKEPDKLNRETYLRVLAAKKALERREKATAPVIGTLVSHHANPFFYEVIRQMDHRLRLANYTPLTIFTDNGGVTSRADIEKLCAADIQALVLMPPFQAEDVTAEWLASLQIPVIQVFNNLYPAFDSILMNDERGGYLAARSLLLAGHRRILYIGVKGPHWQGFLRAHAEMAVPVSEKNATFLRVMRNQTDAISETIRQVQPTAIFAHTEYAALETLQACARLHIPIPEEMSLIAYDDYPWMTMMKISAVSHPMDCLAEGICQAILQRTTHEAPEKPLRLMIEPQLISRDSVRICREENRKEL